MTSGPCTVTEGGACFRTPNYPDDYGSSQDCEIAVSGAGFARATAFDTESCCDYVTIGGTQYSGNGGALASSGVPVGDGTAVAWHADSSTQRSGAEVCGASCEDEFCGPHGSCGSDGVTCTCHPIDGWSGTAWSGDTCDTCPEGWGGNSCEVRCACVSRALYYM
eukprot:COSAG06_NODE_95_length_24425_cov_882.571035_18_plen_164_part_00